MKSSYVHLAILLTFVCEPASRCFGQLSDMQTAFSQGAAGHQNIFVYIHASWCTPCRELERSVLPSPSVQDSLKNYIFLSLSLDESDDGKVLAKKYGITYVPSFLLLSPEHYLLQYTTGVAVDTSSFLQLLSSYRKNGSIKGFSNEMSMKYPDFYENYFTAFPRQTPDTLLAIQYLNIHRDWQDEVSFNIMSNMWVGRRYISYFLDHENAYYEKYGILYYDRVYQAYHSFMNTQIIKHKDTALYKLFDKVLSSIDSIRGYDKSRLSQFRYIGFLAGTGVNWHQYIDVVTSYTEKYGTQSLRGFCEDIYRTCTDTSVCRIMSQRLAKYLASGQDQNENAYLVLAILLHKAGIGQDAVNAYRTALKFPVGEEKRKYLQDQWLKYQ